MLLLYALLALYALEVLVSIVVFGAAAAKRRVRRTA
jgi:hypothetical protein